MAKPKVLISDELSPRAVEIFAERGCDVDFKPGLKPAELRAIVGNYEGLAIRSATKVTAEVLAEAKKLKVVGRAGIGVDNVDIKSATAHGVVVMNTPYGNAITTAEHAIALMFAVARQIPDANASTQAGKWEKNRFMGTELSFKTLGLIGCGNIGSIVAERAIGLKMRVIAYDPVPVRPARPGARRREGDARPGAGARRLHHRAHAAHRADQEHPQPRQPDEDQEGRAHHQLRARRPGRRAGGARPAGLRPHRRRGLRRLQRGAGQVQRAVRRAQPGQHAASRRLDARGAGERGPAGRRADGGLSADRRHRELAQHAQRHGRGGAAARALPRPRREAGLVRGPAHRHRHQGGVDRVRGRRGGAQRQAAVTRWR